MEKIKAELGHEISVLKAEIQSLTRLLNSKEESVKLWQENSNYWRDLYGKALDRDTVRLEHEINKLRVKYN